MDGTSTPAAKPGEIAQTLDRGLRVLELLAGEDDGLTPTDVANRLGVHRSIAARLLATLLNRGFVSRRKDGRYVLGTVLLSLARQVSNNLLVVAAPLLAEIAERLGCTVVLHVADGQEAVALASVEPRTADFHVGIRPGARHPLTVAATGVAILAGRAPQAGEREQVGITRERGYAVTTSELVPNFTGIAAPILVHGSADASVGLIVPADRTHDEHIMGREVITLATRISQSFH